METHKKTNRIGIGEEELHTPSEEGAKSNVKVQGRGGGRGCGQWACREDKECNLIHAREKIQSNGIKDGERGRKNLSHSRPPGGRSQRFASVILRVCMCVCV